MQPIQYATVSVLCVTNKLRKLFMWRNTDRSDRSTRERERERERDPAI